MEKRLDALRKRFRSIGVSNFIVTRFENFDQGNIRYLCGYTGSNGILLVTEKDAHFITDGRYTSQAGLQVKGAEVHIYSGGTSISDAFVRELKNNEAITLHGKIGIESTSTSVQFVSALREAFPNSQIVETNEVVELLSAVRDEEEIDAVRRAAAITDKVFEKLTELIKPGVTESQISAEITYHHKVFGAERNAFEPIVASGLRSALPHGIASNKVIEKGDFVTCDMGGFVDGYASDATRTYVVGKPSAKQKEVYQIVYEAQCTAEEAVAPGVKACDIDSIARNIISKAGYGQYFTHSLGHGLGHVVHAYPRLSYVSKSKLEPGNIVTVEPGIYIHDFGGVRIENDIVVTTNGHEVLNKFPKELIEL